MSTSESNTYIFWLLVCGWVGSSSSTYSLDDGGGIIVPQGHTSIIPLMG